MTSGQSNPTLEIGTNNNQEQKCVAEDEMDMT